MGKRNSIQLIGNTGDDIKIHHFEGGGCIGNVSLATTETYKNKAGEKIENTEWHRLVFRNKGAELIEKYVPKGGKLFVEGRLKYRKWQDKDGKDVYTAEIHVSDFEFLGSKEGSNQHPNSQPEQSSQPQQSDSQGQSSDDDDLPF